MNDERLNPLTVRGQPAHGPPTAIAPPDGSVALLWTFGIAVAPIVCDAIFTSVIGHRPFYSIGLFHLGLGLFGISLAALVRILGHGRGSAMIPFLMLAAIVEVVLALYFGGSFSQEEIHRSAIETDIHNISAALKRPGPAILKQESLNQIKQNLDAVRSIHPAEDPGAYIVLGIFGGFSLIVLIRFWANPTEPERRAQADTR